MAISYKNPPVIYTVAKVIYTESIGNHSDEKYKKLLSQIESLGFDSYSVSKVMGVQVKQSDNQFTTLETSVERVGYFSANRHRCLILDENSIEFRLSEYDNHSRFLDEFLSLLGLCFGQGIAQSHKLREIELHYVDIFAPRNNYSLKDMLSNSMSLPIEQFYSDETDALKLGAINFTRISKSGKSKISVNLEQINSKDLRTQRYLPNALVEPDNKLNMPLEIERLVSEDKHEYAIVHTACGSVDVEGLGSDEDLRSKFEELYIESRKTFDHMISPDVCGEIWEQFTK